MNPVLSSMPSGLGAASISEMVQVPDELFDWASSSQIQAVYFEVKRTSSVNFIQTVKDGPGKISVHVDAPNEQSAKISRKLLE